MKIILVVLLVPILFSCSNLESGKSVNEETANKHYKSLRIVRGKMYVPVEIKGERFWFMLDTGMTSQGSVSENVIKKLKLSPLKGQIAYSGGWGGDKKKWNRVRLFKVPKVKVVNATFGKLVFMEDKGLKELNKSLKDSDFQGGKRFKVDGVVGIGMLRHVTVLIDVRNETIEFDGKKPLLKNKIDFDFFNQRVILVPLKLNNRIIKNFIFDTGATITHIRRDLIAMLELEITDKQIEVIDSKGDSEIANIYKVRALCASGLCRRDFEVLGTSFHKYNKKYVQNGIVGSTFWKALDLIFIDFESKQISFE